ncbi:MAG TPA: asparagine synthase (glutamine-hydrolyzing) [Gammaproteobacteria bacterium]|nr:asparagine synthase (glutamine-hydrolyzing) [Gammaproteobacteria bacterium]
MCGIAGILKFHADEAVEYARLDKMRRAQSHRGPDASGVVIRGRAGLAHNRLSIIDLDRGQQPMADGATWISYNGELYNFRELRKELEAKGCRFATDSDTEVVLKAYRVYGDDCVRELRGMFAFAIWDRKRQKLLLARDRLGIKPLYYAQRTGELLFASEIKGILAAGGTKPELNVSILPEFLATRYVSGAETFFQGVSKLLPAHVFTWTPEQGPQLRRYWQLPERVSDPKVPFETHVLEVRSRLEEAVRSHLMSDVPLGLFLSGGIDSSALAGLMAPMVKDPIQSFSVGFAEHGFNELDYARQVAKSVGAQHRDIQLTADDYFRLLPRMLWHEDEPIAFTSSVCLYAVSELAKRHVKVVLTGEGADELFLGYNKYRVTAWNERLGRPYWAAVPPSLRMGISRLVQRFPRKLRRYAERSFLGPTPGVRGLFYENFAVFPEALQQRLLRDDVPRRDPYVESLRHYDRAPGGSLERMSHADMQTYMVELLMKQDQMSMAASLESRVPFLDHRFVEYVAAMPAKHKLHGWETKAVLRAAVKDVIPKEILTRGKMGFPVPFGRWLRGSYSPLLDDLVLSERAQARGLFDSTYVRHLVDEHLSGNWDHGERLWALVNLELWQRMFLDGEAPEAVLDVKPITAQRAAA